LAVVTIQDVVTINTFFLMFTILRLATLYRSRVLNCTVFSGMAPVRTPIANSCANHRTRHCRRVITMTTTELMSDNATDNGTE
jgi:hypothetical protein